MVMVRRKEGRRAKVAGRCVIQTESSNRRASRGKSRERSRSTVGPLLTNHVHFSLTCGEAGLVQVSPQPKSIHTP